MAEMNRSMNRPRCFLPPALCLRFPALKACTEDLPLVLQRPETFRLIMGILQEINQEKMGPVRVLSCVENTSLVSQRPREQQLQTGALREVKQESGDLGDHYQPIYNMDSDLHQEWSLKGVEELFMEPEESQLRPDCCCQADEGAGHSGAAVVDEKPSPRLHLVHSYFDQRASNQAAPLMDEKPLLQLQLRNSYVEQERSLQERPLPLAEAFIAKERPDALQATVLADIKPSDAAQLLSKEPLRDRPDLKSKCLDSFLNINRELGGHVGHREIQTQEEFSLPDAATTSNHVMLHKAVCRKRNTVRIAARWLKDKRAIDAWRSRIRGTDCELKHRRKKTTVCQKSQAAPPKMKSWISCKVRSSSISERKTQMLLRKRRNVHNILRKTNVILGLPAMFSEQEKSHLGKECSQNSARSSKSCAYKGSECSLAFFEKGVYKEDSQQHTEYCEVADSEPCLQQQAHADIAEFDCCESMLSLALCQLQPSKPCPEILDGNGSPAEELIIRTDCVEEDVHAGQCQRTNPNQWHFAQQAKRRAGLHESRKIIGGTVPAPDQGRFFSPTSSCIMEGHAHLDDGGGSTTYPQSRPQSSEDKGSPLEEGEMRGSTTEDQQVGPSPQIAVEPLHVSPQAEQGYVLNKSHKKRMRGTLQSDEGQESNGQQQSKRCHRSDGKHWRCVRECMFGAYYCEHHLRARRIGYNRRKARDVNAARLESPNKQSALSGTNAL